MAAYLIFVAYALTFSTPNGKVLRCTKGTGTPHTSMLGYSVLYHRG